MQIEPYLNFDGRCEEAVEFYRSALGAEVLILMRFGEMPDPPADLPPSKRELVMHTTFRIGDATLSASDGCYEQCQGQPRFEGIALRLIARDVAEAEQFFTALSEGGTVQMPLAPTFFATRFGMVADRFGVAWMIYVGE